MLIEQVGFVGLGIMGQAMAKNLYGDEPLTVYNRTRERTRALQEMGARVADTPRQAVRIRSPLHGEQLLFLGPRQLLRSRPNLDYLGSIIAAIARKSGC